MRQGSSFSLPTSSGGKEDAVVKGGEGDANDLGAVLEAMGSVLGQTSRRQCCRKSPALMSAL